MDDVPGVHPGATELQDGRDNDCDGEVDEDEAEQGLRETAPLQAKAEKVWKRQAEKALKKAFSPEDMELAERYSDPQARAELEARAQAKAELKDQVAPVVADSELVALKDQLTVALGRISALESANLELVRQLQRLSAENTGLNGALEAAQAAASQARSDRIDAETSLRQVSGLLAQVKSERVAAEAARNEARKAEENAAQVKADVLVEAAAVKKAKADVEAEKADVVAALASVKTEANRAEVVRTQAILVSSLIVLAGLLLGYILFGRRKSAFVNVVAEAEKNVAIEAAIQETTAFLQDQISELSIQMKRQGESSAKIIQGLNARLVNLEEVKNVESEKPEPAILKLVSASD
ncbi:MAG: putative metal-binding motif-containing protein [Patescibacteria group bacterium]|jgi:hypothetical protein